MDSKQIINSITTYATEYGLKILAAILIWIIGSWIIKKVMKVTSTIMMKRKYDESLQKFLLNLINWILKILLIIVLLSKLGVETTSFAAVIAAAGLAIGMALQGSLANFAGGVLIMIFKPIKIGDLIKAQGEIGVVKEIEIFTTKLTSPDNKLVIIPNGTLSNGNITNYTAEGRLRVDLTFGVGYDADIKQTKEVLLKVLTDNKKVLQDPAPTVNVSELADSSVNFAVRPWANTADYWDVYFETTENVKLALDKAGIEIPYPHQVEIQKQG
ncbi:mechanosensitive ion channel family protein [Tenacibaculum soleae]|uniref:mechanosensitive ion channel family protein n=1 Tax=Tenacibaculum soleae TaxID=447689 RepID=UPI002301C03A|nr:mechanosensitive ion channel domain-containing protein [Tenacibaculum soleae]